MILYAEVTRIRGTKALLCGKIFTLFVLRTIHEGRIEEFQGFKGMKFYPKRSAPFRHVSPSRQDFLLA